MAEGNRRPLLWLLLLLVAALFAAIERSPIDPVAWDSPPAPALAGPLQPNLDLRRVEPVGAGLVRGPEDVELDALGRVYAGTEDGRIVRITRRPGAPDSAETFATTGGRPFGLHFDAGGRLIVCDGRRGLLAVDTQGAVETLATAAGGLPFGFADDLDIAADGRIYFSDASSRFGVDDYVLDLLEGRPHGRLLRHDPAAGTTEVLLDGLHFANGVALSPGGDYVLVNETWRYRVTRYWLAGPRAGQAEVFVDGLPGFPDGISRGEHGVYWLALFTVRQPTADFLHRHPPLKALVAQLPAALRPQPEPYGLVLEVDGQGRIRRSLHDPGGALLRQTSSAVERQGALWVGTLHGDFVGRLAGYR
jgi:sugar lactone lactonase YvrE